MRLNAGLMKCGVADWLLLLRRRQRRRRLLALVLQWWRWEYTPAPVLLQHHQHGGADRQPAHRAQAGQGSQLRRIGRHGAHNRIERYVRQLSAPVCSKLLCALAAPGVQAPTQCRFCCGSGGGRQQHTRGRYS